MPSTPQFHSLPDILDDSGPHCSADRRGRGQNKPIGQRRRTRGMPPSIVVPDAAMPFSSAGAGENVQIQGNSKSVEAGTARQTSPCEIERISPTRPVYYAFIDKPSNSYNCHRGKKRKLAADTVAVPEAQEEVDTIPASEANGASGCVQPYASDEEAGQASVIPPGLLGKLSLIGSAEVLRDLKYTLFRLRSHPSEGSLISTHRIDTICTSDLHNTLRSFQTAQVFLMLRNELEVTEIGEQIYKFRKRLALSRFFDLYDMAQKNPSSFLEEDAETI